MADRLLSATERRRSLAAIIGAIGIVGFTIGLSYPLLSLILAERGIGSALIGLNAASTALALIVFSPLIPRIVAAVGLRALMLACVGVDIACLLLLRVVDDVYAWFPLRFLMGMAAAGLFVATEAWINSIAREESRGRLVGLYATVLAAGFAAGPLLLPVTGIEGWPPFLVAAAAVALAGLPLAWAGRHQPRIDIGPGFGILGFVARAPTIAGSVALFGMIEGGCFALLPLYGLRSGLSAELSALMLTAAAIGSIGLQVPVGWLADRMDRRTVLMLCGLAAGLGAASLPLVIGSPWLLALVLFLWGGLAAGLYTVALIIAGQRFRGAELVSANAAFGVLYGVGSIGGPALGGFAMDLWDPHGLPVTLGLASALFLVLALGRRAFRRRMGPGLRDGAG